MFREHRHPEAFNAAVIDFIRRHGDQPGTPKRLATP